MQRVLDDLHALVVLVLSARAVRVVVHHVGGVFADVFFELHLSRHHFVGFADWDLALAHFVDVRHLFFSMAFFLGR